MQLSLNTNSLSNLVQNSLTGATGRLNTAIERMTSGYKINGAKDNAAGYAISTSLGSKLSSYAIAQDNVAMGLDMLTTATDNLDLIASHLQRMRDLAEQASNGVYGDDSLAALQAEFNARKSEILRVFDNSDYNGVSLFRDSGSKFIEKVDSITEEEALDEGYTIIKTKDDLKNIKNDLKGKYILMNDIDLSGEEWEAIGSLNDAFKGELDGNGYTISNLYIHDKGEYQGLFGRMEGATIKNLAVEGANVGGSRYVGALAGYSYESNICNCYSTGVISGLSDAGGFVGYNTHNAKIENSYSRADVIATDYRAGGLVGYNADNSTITKCLSSGDVECKTDGGGLAGQNAGSISNSFATGCVNAESHAGGLAGYTNNGGSATSCYWDKDCSNASCGVAEGSSDGVSGVDSLTLGELMESGVLPGANLAKDSQDTEITLQVGIHSDESSKLTIDTAFSLSSLSTISVSSSTVAKKTLNKLDNIIKLVNEKQTEYGASYNRLESALESISVSIDNLTSSQSTIRDADIAEVSSEYIRNQILQQASATLLAAANQSPAFALQLI